MCGKGPRPHLWIELDGAVLGGAWAVVEESPQLFEAIDAACLQVLRRCKQTVIRKPERGGDDLP